MISNILFVDFDDTNVYIIMTQLIPSHNEDTNRITIAYTDVDYPTSFDTARALCDFIIQNMMKPIVPNIVEKLGGIIYRGFTYQDRLSLIQKEVESDGIYVTQFAFGAWDDRATLEYT